MTDMPHATPVLTPEEWAHLDETIGRCAAPLRHPEPQRTLRWHVADALLGVGDLLTRVGHAAGRLAERLDPHP